MFWRPPLSSLRSKSKRANAVQMHGAWVVL